MERINHEARCICALCVLGKFISQGKKKNPVPPCRFYLQGNCRHEDSKDCNFNHLDFEQIPECVFGGDCKFKLTKCLFVHPVCLEEVDSTTGNEIADLSLSLLSRPRTPITAGARRKTKRRNKKRNKGPSHPFSSSPSHNSFQPLGEDDGIDDDDSDSSGLPPIPMAAADTSVVVVDAPPSAPIAEVIPASLAKSAHSDTEVSKEKKEDDPTLSQHFFFRTILPNKFRHPAHKAECTKND